MIMSLSWFNLAMAPHPAENKTLTLHTGLGGPGILSHPSLRPLL